MKSGMALVGIFLLNGLLVITGLNASCATAAAQEVPAEELKKITDALPKAAYIKPLGQRRLLVFTLTRGFRHSSIPHGIEALRRMGDQTGAFEVIASEDPAVFESESLKRFDGVCLLNTTGELFTGGDLDKLSSEERKKAVEQDYRLKQSLLAFVRGGKGLIGIHSATDTFYKWPEYGDMIGGYFDGHPWNEQVTLKVMDPGNPVTQMFNFETFKIADEIYQLKDPYSKGRVHPLLSLDPASVDLKKPGVNRRDGDFAVSYVREYGKGRVFYCSLGHREEIYWSPTVLAHYLAGIQFALGDLSAPASPAGAAAPDFEPIFNGRDLTGWATCLADVDKRKKLTPEELAKAEAEADQHKAEHWTVKDGVLCFDGKGDNLATTKKYDDFEMLLEWKIEPDSDSGIYIRSVPQVQIWDATKHPEGSGGLYNNQISPNSPLIRADRPIGEWNTMRIRALRERINVWLNDVRVVEETPLQNFWNPGTKATATGPIELQAHSSPVYFRNIRVKQLTPPAALYQPPTWFPLFNQQDLSYWVCKAGTWQVEEAAMKCKGGGSIFNDRGHQDYILTCEFKLSKGAKSGIYFRTTDIKDPEASGFMLVLADEESKEKPGTSDTGALAGIVAPKKVTMRPVGEWNTIAITCDGSRVDAVINGDRIIDIDLAKWTEAGKNPDGTTNPYAVALKDLKPLGFVGFKDSGDAPVWVRHLSMMPIEQLPVGLRNQRNK